MHLLVATDSYHYTQKQNSITSICDTSDKTTLKLKKHISVRASTMTFRRVEMTMFPLGSFSIERKMLENFKTKLQMHLQIYILKYEVTILNER